MWADLAADGAELTQADDAEITVAEQLNRLVPVQDETAGSWTVSGLGV